MVLVAILAYFVFGMIQRTYHVREMCEFPVGSDLSQARSRAKALGFVPVEGADTVTFGKVALESYRTNFCELKYRDQKITERRFYSH